MPVPAPVVDNNANMDPRLVRHADRIENRLNNPGESTGRAIDMAAGRLRDLGDGQKASAVGGFARRGIMDGGQQAAYGAQVDAGVQQQAAGAAADITMRAREGDDRFMLSSTDALAAPASGARQDRQIANQQWDAQNNAAMRQYETETQVRLQQQAQEFAQQQAILHMLQEGTAPAGPTYPAPTRPLASPPRGFAAPPRSGPPRSYGGIH